jgi:hypothetical protein
LRKEALAILRASEATSAPRAARRARNPESPMGGALLWLPVLVLAAGLAAGVVLWDRWGLAVAFEAIRAYCF